MKANEFRATMRMANDMYTRDPATARQLCNRAIMSLARGCAQRSFLADALTADGATPIVSALRGKARTYAGRYQASQSAVLARCERAGCTVVRTPGPRGGEWSARYRIIPPATV